MNKGTKLELLVAISALLIGALALLRDVYDYKITDNPPHEKDSLGYLDPITPPEPYINTSLEPNTNNNKFDFDKEYNRYFNNKSIALSNNSILSFTQDGLLCLYQKSADKMDPWVDSSFVVPIKDIEKIEVGTVYLDFDMYFKMNSPTRIKRGPQLHLTTGYGFNTSLFQVFVNYGLKRFNSNIKVRIYKFPTYFFVGVFAVVLLIIMQIRRIRNS